MTVTVRLKEVCDITMGQAPSGDAYNNEGHGWPLIAGAGDFSGTRPAPKKWTAQASKICRAGDIVLGIRASIGEKVLADKEYCLGRGVAGLRARPQLDSRYLWHWLTHTKDTLAAKGRGATFLQVNRSDIGELTVNLPNLSEQKRIAAVLDQVDALRSKRRQSIALLGDLAQSIFLDMFGDPLSNPHGLPIDPLGQHVEEFRYGTSEKSTTEGYPTLRIPNVVGGTLDISEIKTVPVSSDDFNRLRLRDGDLLFVRSNGNPDYVGRCAIYSNELFPESMRGNVIYASYLIRARLSAHTLHPGYISAYLQSPAGRAELRERCKTSAGQYNINTKGISSLKVPVPPFEMQQEFDRRVQKVRSEQSAHQRHLTVLDDLFASLQHRAFSGTLWDHEAAA